MWIAPNDDFVVLSSLFVDLGVRLNPPSPIYICSPIYELPYNRVKTFYISTLFLSQIYVPQHLIATPNLLI